jgi:hypothetical protein
MASKDELNDGDVQEKYMANLIEELSAEDYTKSFATYATLTRELLRRVDKEKIVCPDDYVEKEDSVFDRVEQHMHNGDNHLYKFEEQFQKVHKVDHKTFTERWLLEHTGKAYKLENVIENPSFQDFVGVYDIMPRQAYVASKMIIDEHDFMGVFDLSCNACKPKRSNTYVGVAATSDQDGLHFDEAEKDELAKHEAEVGTAHKDDPLEDSDQERSEVACCASDAQVNPHALGTGHYLQFRLRRENVVQYLNDSLTSRKLRGLIPEDPLEPIYVFTASSNGIMRFHPWGGTARKLWHGYGDSASGVAFTQNIGHAAKYGCFCFGVIYKECKNYEDDHGKVRKGGRTIVMRYNRWATDNAPIYAMVRQKEGHENTALEKDDHRKNLERQHKDPTGFENFCSCCIRR